jgi:hypothetical protein
MTFGIDGLNEFGELQRDWVAENKGVRPEFFVEKVGVTTGEDGIEKPIFIDCVRIHIAGDLLCQATLPVDETVKARFRPEFEAWKNTGEIGPRGTALTDWGVLTKAQVEELARKNVLTIEDVSALSDAHVGIVPNGQALREKARIFIEASADTKASREMQATNRALKSQIDALEAKFAKLDKSKGRAA